MQKVFPSRKGELFIFSPFGKWYILFLFMGKNPTIDETGQGQMSLTLQSGIDVGQGITVGPGKFV